MKLVLQSLRVRNDNIQLIGLSALHSLSYDYQKVETFFNTILCLLKDRKLKIFLLLLLLLIKGKSGLKEPKRIEIFGGDIRLLLEIEGERRQLDENSRDYIKFDETFKSILTFFFYLYL